MKQALSVLSLVLLIALATACAPAGEPADTAAEADAGHDMAEPAAAPAAPVDRDAWSKPEEVYAFVGIGAGQTVLDLMAGGGYNTVKLMQAVGPDGTVIAEKPSEAFMERLAEGGDLAGAANLKTVAGLEEVADASVDALIAVRAYHLFPDVPAQLAEVFRILKPGAVVGVVELRLNQTEGHDMQTHRVGEQTVIGDFTAAGFEYVGESDVLRIEGDDYTSFMPPGGARFMGDRMLLKFRKP